MAKDDQFVDEVDQPTTDGMGTSLVIITTLVLIAAFIIVQMALKGYGEGMFGG
jgi:hypothetical protein